MSDSCDDGSSSEESVKSDRSLKRKSKKKSHSHKSRRKEKKREKKKSKKKKKDKTKDKVKKERDRKKGASDSRIVGSSDDCIGPELPADLMEERRRLAPMSKEEWEAQQKQVRRVLDEETGRYRLVRGTGEILEEIVSKERHKEINRQATMADAAYFQTVLSKRI